MEENKNALLKKWKETSNDNLMKFWEVDFVDLGKDYIILKMPVTEKVTQIDGVLHGGATLALAESAGSIAAWILYRKEGESIRGIELSGNHVRAAKVGETVFAKATCINPGRTLQLWEIKITNQDDKLISFCKFTTIKIKE
ncbi:thioesterase [Capnocytophaga stomatis]|uniref:Thioesterase n=1 Tax=Capnocytophaga stomatis TaxID=1848904 RepID=A0A250G278_9FLAO|nr:PaaI family thioesterase [Capnocytophaga stomatis]ATA90428.1 thioesterase [Capnocytophaga stomatis]GIJ97154.1 thioesterase [Capnocytophaga stomatis]GIM49509.1 thioesterase [Capnocytophaga stomatis]